MLRIPILPVPKKKKAAREVPPVICGRNAPAQGGRLTQQSQRRLREQVRLRQHRGARLHQDVQLGKLRALIRHIDILDPAVRRRQILIENRQLLAGQIQPLDVRADLRPHVRQGLDGRLDLAQGGVSRR